MQELPNCQWASATRKPAVIIRPARALAGNLSCSESGTDPELGRMIAGEAVGRGIARRSTLVPKTEQRPDSWQGGGSTAMRAAPVGLDTHFPPAYRSSGRVKDR